MTQQECLAKTGEAYGVMEPNGDMIWYSDWVSAELSRYKVVKTPEQIAERKATAAKNLEKAREVRQAKKNEIKRKQVEKCEGCNYTLALCICPEGKKASQKVLEEVSA